MEERDHHEAGFSHGIELFNTRRFFDAHEAWEEIWLPSPEPQKTFLQGIIQIAAAYHHYLRGNRAGACSLLNAGLRRLGPFPGEYHGIEIESLRLAAREWCDQLGEGRDPGADCLPQIRHARRESQSPPSE
jgi:predicted metal-dependent hydrolase